MDAPYTEPAALAPARAGEHTAVPDETVAVPVPEPSPRRSRWRLWVALGVALLVLRVGLSLVLTPLVASRLSRVLGARVDVGDVSFSPLDAVLTLRRVTVHAPDGTRAPADAAPVVADRVRLDVQWLPLLHRSLLVRELVLESGRLELDRLNGGTPSVATFLRADPRSELPPDWTFALDRIVLRDMALRVRDPADGDAPPLEVALRAARVSTLPRRVTAFGRAPNLHVDAAVGGGRIRVDGTSDLRDDGVVLDARIRATGVPLAPLRSYLRDLAWSGVDGRLSARLHYQRDPARRDLLTGRVSGHRIEVTGLAGPALAVRRAVADVEGIDLRTRRVAIRSLTLYGAALAARPDLGTPVPLLAGTRIGPAAAGSAPPWRWTIGSVAVPAGRVHFAGRDGDVVVVMNVAARNLGPTAYWSPLRARFRRGDGAATFDGTASLTHGLAIEGRLTAQAVDVAGVARAFGAPWADLARSGRAEADLNLAFEPGATDGSAVDVHGRVSLADLFLAGPEPTAFAIGADTVQLDVAGVVARGNDARRPRPVEVRISDVVVGEPLVQLSRTHEGWVLPPFTEEPNDGRATSGVAAVHPDAPTVQLAVDRLRTNGGRVAIVDAAASPSVSLDLAISEGWGHDVRLPGAAVGDFEVAGSDLRLGMLRLGSTRGVEGRALRLAGEAVPLAAAAPFLARAGLPYRVEGDSASFVSDVAVGGGGWTADATLTLREPALAGDTAALQDALGGSVENALDRLRDRNGDVTVRLALAAPASGDTRALSDAVARALRDPTAGAAPFRIAFAPGRVELTAAGARQVAAVAETLNARPGLVVALAASVSSQDRRWLAEQALAGELAPAGVFSGMLEAFGIRGDRERIRQALEARADGRAGRLGADDEAVLEDMLARRGPVDPEQFAMLAGARLARVTAELAGHFGIARARVVREDAGPDDAGAAPAVRGRIVVDPRLARPAAPDVEPAPAATRIAW